MKKKVTIKDYTERFLMQWHNLIWQWVSRETSSLMLEIVIRRNVIRKLHTSGLLHSE